MVPIILVVDDDQVHRRLLDVVLTQIGYAVRTAASAEAALDVIRRVRPRMVVLALALPGMSGLDLTRRLRTHAALRDVVIIAVAAAASPGDIEVALASGCDDHVLKTDRRRLVALVRRHLPT